MSALKEFEIIRQIDTPRFVLSFMRSQNTGETEVVLEGKTAGRHLARHQQANILDENGRLLESRKIDDRIANFIFDNFLQRGDTESFQIFQSDLESGYLLPRTALATTEKQVRHQLTDAERNFTANGEKLQFHQPIFEKYAATGFGSIIRATLTNHQ